MHPRDILAMGRGNHPGQRHGPRPIVLSLIALGAIVGALIVSGCPGGDNEEVRHATLLGSSEVPPRTTAATGAVTLTINDARTRITYREDLVPPFTSNLTGSHIHVQQPTANGPIVLHFCTNQTPPVGVLTPQACPTAGGTITGTLTAADFIPSAAATALGVNTFADAVAQILSGSTGAYANAHTVTNPSGEVRGQIGP